MGDSVKVGYPIACLKTANSSNLREILPALTVFETPRASIQPLFGKWAIHLMSIGDLNWIAKFIWGIAENILRDLYVRGKYHDGILPMTALRRLDAVLDPDNIKTGYEISFAPYLASKRSPQSF
jgi:HsdM-like protein